MNSRVLVWSIVSFCSGFVLYHVLTYEPEYVPIEERSVAHHWKRVREYNAYMWDRSNYKPVPGTDMAATTPPDDIEPSLMMLEKAHEIEHADLVFPLIPEHSEAAIHWMKFCSEHRDTIIYGIGRAQHPDYKPSGEHPLRLHMWFLKEAKPDIQQMMKEMEAIAAEEKLNSTIEK